MAKKTGKINTARFPGETDTDYKKRLARNERVRNRRAKQRAAKKAAKRTPRPKAERRGIPRRAADLAAAAAPPAPKKLALLLTRGEITVFVNGERIRTHDSPSVSSTDFAGALHSLGTELGADVLVCDLRPAEE